MITPPARLWWATIPWHFGGWEKQQQKPWKCGCRLKLGRLGLGQDHHLVLVIAGLGGLFLWLGRR
jgi:hypothetical protein